MSVHIGAQPGEIAERVLLPGDPMRAKWIAETFLEDAKCYTDGARNARLHRHLAGRARSRCRAPGMGMPSASIYTHELINEYGVNAADPDRLVRRARRGPEAR